MPPDIGNIPLRQRYAFGSKIDESTRRWGRPNFYATVPHYRLARLHQLLLEYPEYHAQAVEVHGYFVSPERRQVHPTVLDVLGPAYAPREFHGVSIDNSVLEDCVVKEKNEILKEGEREQTRLAEEARRR